MADIEWKECWEILVVEDDPDDYVIVQSLLGEVRYRTVHLHWVNSYQDALNVVGERMFDAALIDFSLGAHNGLDLINELTRLDYPAPLILLTGMGSYELDLQAMQAGAVDYLSKAEITPLLLERSIRYAIERKGAEQSLRQAKNELEERVRERTHELLEKNLALENEVARRTRLERELTEVRFRLLDRTESERIELARELHDGAIQELYGLTFSLSALDGRVPADSKGDVASAQEQTQNILRSLRAIAGELRPPALAPFGLEKAIRSHAEAFQQAHPELSILLDLTPDEQTLPERVRLALYRIYQVTLTNVIRHAAANQVQVSLSLDEQQAQLEIADNGKGFVVPERWYEFAHKGHLGLAGAAERAAAINATLQVKSAPGLGAQIIVTVPFQPIPAPGEARDPNP